MKEIVADKGLAAFCGLYCGACRQYLKGKCPGCAKNEKAGWCKIRKCNLENRFLNCSECRQFAEVSDCSKFNNFISKIFALIFRFDRKACILRIKELGVEKYAQEMAGLKLQSIKK
jgi:hypothetical protein